MNEQTSPSPSLMDIIKSVNRGADDDVAYVIAVAINAYNESRRRLHGRVLYTPNDVKALLNIVDTLIRDTPINAPLTPPRAYELTIEERDKLLNSLEAPMVEPTRPRR